MFPKIYFVLTIVFATGIQLSVQQKCHTQQLVDCYMKVTTFAEKHDVPYPVNEKELREQCGYISEMRTCAYNYSTACMSELERSLGDFVLSSTISSMKDFCNPDHEIYKNYVNNAKCIGDHYSGTGVCIKGMLAITEVLPKTKPDGRLTMLCCGFTAFRDCLFEHYGRNCNKEVVNLMDVITTFPVSDVVVQACKVYEESSSKCPVLPTANDLKGTYKDNILGSVLSVFLKE